MQKEPLIQSDRFKLFITSGILETLILLTGIASAQFGWEISMELLESIALAIGGLAISSLIVGKSYRNTPIKKTKKLAEIRIE